MFGELAPIPERNNAIEQVTAPAPGLERSSIHTFRRFLEDPDASNGVVPVFALPFPILTCGSFRRRANVMRRLLVGDFLVLLWSCEQLLRALERGVLAVEGDDRGGLDRRPSWLGPCLGVPDAEDGPAPSQIVAWVFRRRFAYRVHLAQQGLLAFEAATPSLVEGCFDHGCETFEGSEVSAVRQHLVVGMATPRPRFSREHSQVLLHGVLVRSADDLRMLLACLANSLQ